MGLVMDVKREVIMKAAAQFRAYEKIHLNKIPPDYEKANINGAFALMCEQAIKKD